MKTKSELLPYQKEAYEKLKGLKIGALYMEMGTGKTRTALELIKNRFEQGKIDHVIWLCPCSIKGDIEAGIHRHSDLAPGDLLTITGIETLSTSIRELSKLINIATNKRVYLVVDESSKIKNHAALRSKHITKLAELCPYRIILNGTPITKNETDLFSQWYLLDWRILGYRSFWSFAANHIQYDERNPGRILETLNVDYLAQKIEPYTYQVKKADVLNLPPKSTRTEYFYLTGEQYDHYNEVSDKLFLGLDEMKPETIYRLFGALQAIVSGYVIKVYEDLHTERYRYFIDPMDDPRVVKFLDVIKTFGNEKVIIFCEYVDEINIIHSLLPNSVEFYGAVPQTKRQELIEGFRNDVQYFIASKSCGSYGLDLPHCHNIVYYSNDWDWGTRAQSEDRVHRYGQEHNVNIVEICSRDTIEVAILECLQRKESLSNEFKAKLAKGISHNELKQYLAGGKSINGKTISKQ